MKKFMKLNKKNIVVGVLSVFLLATSCDSFDLDVNENPNSPKVAAPDLILANAISEGIALFADNLNNATHGLMRITTSYDTYDMDPNDWNGTWNLLYSGPLKDLRDLKIATEEVSPHYNGIAKILEAYYFSIMVDMWGDVPFDEAFQGDAEVQIKKPAYSDALTIYGDLITQIDEGIASLALPTPVDVGGDPIYGGDADSWTTFAKTLKLKLLLNMKEVDNGMISEIQALVTENDLIGSDAGDDFDEYFVFQFNQSIDPDDRHPWYIDAYGGEDNSFDYIGHQFMVEMLRDVDPRISYYLKRQTTNTLDPEDPTDKQTLPCSQRTDCTYGYLVLNPNIDELLDGNTPSNSVLAGYFGRDHGDPSGIPLDGALRTAPGVYPVGGLYDDEAETVGGNNGNGAGIFPGMTGFMTKFMVAEAILTAGATGDARAILETAIRESMVYVESVSLGLDEDTEAMDEAEIDAYVTASLADYDAATNPLNVVMKQAWFANFGNGFEMYNGYRRTGYPNDLQVSLQPVRGFPLRVPYTLDEINLNGANVPSTVFDVDPIFWDVD